MGAQMPLGCVTQGAGGEALGKATGGYSASLLPRQKLSGQHCCVVVGMDSAPA